jgi:hypothetical protein
MRSVIYSVRSGKAVVSFLKRNGFPNAKLIGSLGRGIPSNHDIDILLPKHKRSILLCNRLMELLDSNEYEYTDWGGIFIKNTHFGDIDVFFTIKDFDY